MGRPAYAEAYYAEPEDLLPRWMKSVIARQSESTPALPFQRAAKNNDGLLPPPRPGILLVMARIAQL
jgi:hypothetical protein